MARIKKSLVIVGNKVTCRERVEAYYSGRNGNPVVFLEPGEVAIVASVDNPCITYSYRTNGSRTGGTATFVCVDFEKGGQTHRASLYYTNIKLVA